MIYNLKYQRVQVLAWFNSFMETVLGVSPLSGIVSRREWAPNGSIMRELAFGKDSSSSEKDSMGETGVLVVLQLSDGVWKPCLPATWVARLFRASPPTYCHWLWCTCQRLSLSLSLFCSPLGENVDLVLSQVSRGFDLPEFLWHVYCFLSFFPLQRSLGPAPPWFPGDISCFA